MTEPEQTDHRKQAQRFISWAADPDDLEPHNTLDHQMLYALIGIGHALLAGPPAAAAAWAQGYETGWDDRGLVRDGDLTKVTASNPHTAPPLSPSEG